MIRKYEPSSEQPSTRLTYRLWQESGGRGLPPLLSVSFSLSFAPSFALSLSLSLSLSLFFSLYLSLSHARRGCRDREGSEVVCLYAEWLVRELRSADAEEVQGCLAHKKQPHSKTLQ